MKKEGELNPIVFSNTLENLAERLIDVLFFRSSHPLLPSSPFEKRMVVVPDTATKGFLLRYFVSHPRLQMAAGVQILSLSEAVTNLLESREKKRIPSFIALSLSIEEKLKQLSFEPLRGYLEGCSLEKRERRISQLSDELARLFGWYGLHGPHFLKQWLPAKSWQSDLWNELFHKESPWTYPIEALKQSSAPFGKIALFGFTYLSLSHLSFFAKQGASLFQLSPSALFWGDFVTEKERVRTRARLKGAAQELWEGLMSEGHPLLGNWGKLHREMLKNLDQFNSVDEEAYAYPQNETVLAILKRSMLFLEKPCNLLPDDSIQIHSATSKLREVEALRDVIETALQSHDDLSPSDFLVLAPNIAQYAPYIEMVFGQGPFPFAIDGIELCSLSTPLQGFLRFLEISKKNYTPSSLFELFDNAAFREKHRFSPGDVAWLRECCSLAEIHFGWEGNPNSWMSGLSRLVQGFAFVPDLQLWKSDVVGQSEMELFNTFIVLVDALHRDLLTLQEKKSAPDWFAWALKMAREHFCASGETDPFFQEVHRLWRNTAHLENSLWSFESIERVFMQIAHKRSGQKGTSEWDRVTFASLSSGKVLSSRWIWCLGMDEGAFPRSEGKSSLSAVDEKDSKDYFPSRFDEDRALFLDLILNAKESLIFSYERINSDDHKQQSFSPLIDELQQYIAQLSVFHHPAHPFDFAYYQPESPIKKSSETDYLAAQALCSPKKKQSRFFHFAPCKEERTIALRDLKNFARHPIAFYFQKVLQIYLQESKDEEEGAFVLSRFENSLLRKSSVKNSVEKVLCLAEASGKLPRGLFKDAAASALKEENLSYFDHLRALGVSAQEITSLPISDLFVPTQIGPVKIIGTLTDITPQGLLINGKGDLASVITSWPLLLVYRLACKSDKPLLMTKKGREYALPIEDPLSAFSRYLDYYFMAKETPSPLMPDWASALLQKSQEEFAKMVHNERSYYAEDPYLSYLQRRGALEELIESFDQWSGVLRSVFAPALKEASDAAL